MPSARFRLVNNKELYDIAADPFEKYNVIEQHPAVVAELRAAYEAWWSEVLPLMVNEAVPESPVRPYWEHYFQQLKSGGIPRWLPPQLQPGVPDIEWLPAPERCDQPASCHGGIAQPQSNHFS